MRILISTDMHANILAAEESVRRAGELGADMHVHLGDSVDIGPWPDETLQFLKDNSVILVKGNHEEYHCSDGYGPVIAARMGKDERNHYEWTTDQLSADSLACLENMTYLHSRKEGNHTFHFSHFPLHDGRIREPWIETDETDLAQAYEARREDVFFFGHIHRFVDAGRAPRFICPGATGISQYPEFGKTVLLLDAGKEGYSLERHRLEWDMERVRKEVCRVNKCNQDWLLENMYRG